MRCCCFLLLSFGCFFFFLLWHAALRLCLPDLGLMLGHCGLCRHHFGLMLSNFGAFCGLCWPLLGKSWDHIGLILGNFGLCWDILGHVGTVLGSCKRAREQRGQERMWRCEDVRMWRCEDVKMWRWEDVKMRGCEDVMWRWEDEKMWRWEGAKMWGCEDVRIWGCEDLKMRRCEDVRMWRCEDEKMWRCEDVKMRRCEDVRMWGWEDVTMWKFLTDPHYWKNPSLRRSREKMEDNQNDFACSREIVIFSARFLFDWMVEDFMRILPHLLAAGKPKCKLHLYKGIFIGHARHAQNFFAFCCLGSSCWGILGYVLAFIFDLGISVSLNFGPCKAFLMLCWGMLHLGYVCLTWGPRWAMFKPCWVVAASPWAHAVPMSSQHVWALPLWSGTFVMLLCGVGLLLCLG